MSRTRIFTPEQCRELAGWYNDFKRIGTFASKARELGVDDDTLRDAIRRANGQDTRSFLKKLASCVPRETPLTTDNEVA